MPAARWHLVRAGHTQIIGSQKQMTGDPFQFLPLFRTHREAELYCQNTGLWEQGIRPRHNRLAATPGDHPMAGLGNVVRQTRADGVNAIGIFVGFNVNRESCWEYYRVSGETGGGVPLIESLPEDERPV